MASLAISAAGMAAGAWLAPAGYAALGATIGSTLFTYAARQAGVIGGGQDVEGPRLDDTKVQSAAFGTPIIVPYGQWRTAGNIIWTSGIREEKETEEVGGKGGGGAEKTTYHYFASFAVALCEGPIDEVLRIWADDEVIWEKGDDRERSDSLAHLMKCSSGCGMTGIDEINIYKGTEDQEPDPIIEAEEGAGNVPAHRGLAYLVFSSMYLEDYGNRIPNIAAEVAVHAEETTVVTGPYSGFAKEYQVDNTKIVENKTIDNPYYWQRPPVLGRDEDVWGPGSPYQGDEFSNEIVEESRFLPVGIRDGVVEMAGYPRPWMWGWSSFDELVRRWFREKLIMDTNGEVLSREAMDLGQQEQRTWGYEDAYHVILDAPPAMAYPGAIDPGIVGWLMSAETWQFLIVTVQNLEENPYDNRQNAIVDSDYLYWNSRDYVAEGNDTHNSDHAYLEEYYNNLHFVFTVGGSFYCVLTGSKWNPWIDYDGPPGESPRIICCSESTSAAHSKNKNVTYQQDIPGDNDATAAGYDQAEGRIWVLSKSKDTLFFLTPELEITDEVPAGNLPSTSAISIHGRQIIAQEGDTYEEYKLKEDLTGIEHVGKFADSPGSFTPYMLLPLDEDAIFSPADGLVRKVASPNGYPLANALADICERAGLSPDAYDTSEVTQTLWGFAHTRPTEAKADLEPLLSAYQIDAVETNGTLRFVPRGGSPQATIPEADLAARPAGEDKPDPVATTRKQELELPRRLGVQYARPGKDRLYEQNEQYAARVTTEAVGEETIQLPVAMTNDEARSLAQTLLLAQWTGRDSYQFATPLRWARIDPGDVVTIEGPKGTYTARITGANTALPTLLQFEAVREDPAIYATDYTPLGVEAVDTGANTVTVSGDQTDQIGDTVTVVDADGNETEATVDSTSYDSDTDTTTVTLTDTPPDDTGEVRVPRTDAADGQGGGTSTGGAVGPTISRILDIPLLRSADDSPGYYIAATGVKDGWRGGAVYVQNAEGDWRARLTVPGTPMGQTQNALGNAPRPWTWDEANTVTVRLTGTGELTNASPEAVLDGGNHALVGQEVIAFRDAVDNGDGTFTLSGLLRGRQGTEWAIAGHTSGERFVALTENLRPYDIDPDRIGQEQRFKVASQGGSVDSADTKTVASGAERLKPWAPAHLQAQLLGGGTTKIQWERRARHSGEWRDNVDVPVVEAEERFEVEVVDNSGAKSTKEVTGTETTLNMNMKWSGKSEVAGLHQGSYVYDPPFFFSCFQGDHKLRLAKHRISDGTLVWEYDYFSFISKDRPFNDTSRIVDRGDGWLVAEVFGDYTSAFNTDDGKDEWHVTPKLVEINKEDGSLGNYIEIKDQDSHYIPPGGIVMAGGWLWQITDGMTLNGSVWTRYIDLHKRNPSDLSLAERIVLANSENIGNEVSLNDGGIVTDGSYLYVLMYSKEIWKLDASDGSQIATAPLPRFMGSSEGGIWYEGGYVWAGLILKNGDQFADQTFMQTQQALLKYDTGLNEKGYISDVLYHEDFSSTAYIAISDAGPCIVGGKAIMTIEAGGLAGLGEAFLGFAYFDVETLEMEIEEKESNDIMENDGRRVGPIETAGSVGKNLILAVGYEDSSGWGTSTHFIIPTMPTNQNDLSLIRVYQLSETVGRGYPAEIQL